MRNNLLKTVEMMDKISFYNIEVESNDNILLYNTLSDSLICFTKQEFEVISILLENLHEFTTEYPILYEEMKKAGFIVNKNFNELEYIKLENKRRIFANSNYHITINPTLECNLTCWYCSVKYTKKEFSEGMSNIVLNNVMAHIKNVVQEQKATSLHLDWFGGEPLMYFDEIIDPISACANKLVVDHNVKFTQHITTNATLMDANRIRRMKELNFTSFQIPLDGNEQRHDKIKFFNNQQGTYRKIIDNINMIADIIPNVYIILRVNYDKQTLKQIQDVISDIAEKSRCKIEADFQRVWQVSCAEKEMLLLKKAKENFCSNGITSNFWAYEPRKFYRCYSDRFHQYTINFDGKIFKCTSNDYGEDKVIGNLLPDGNVAWNDELLGKLFSQSSFENERCLACKKLPICMGPCIQRSYEARESNRPLPCISDQVQYTLDSYIIEDAKKRKLIK